MENEIDWSQVKVGDILPKIPFRDNFISAGGKVEKIEWGTSLYEGAIGDFWVQFPEGVNRFTIISRKIHSVSKMKAPPTI